MPKRPFFLEDAHGIELEPRRIGYERPPDPLSLREFFRHVRMGNRSQAKKPARPLAEHWQRCTVQVRYTKGGSIGKWYSHGAYMARETKDGLGFHATDDNVPVAQTMADWRRQGDSLFFRVIVSPEFGDRLDLKKQIRETITQMELDLQTSLEWIAVAHYNTDRPHVHVVIRGKRDDGRDLRIPPRYVREGLRDRAAAAATRQLGYRTSEDILEAQRREIHQVRFTGLDRRLIKRQDTNGMLRVEPSRDATEFHLERRLIELERMGLATRHGSPWQLSPELERSLRAAQKTRDRVQIMEAHGVMASDTNLPFRLLKLNDVQDVEGKVLVHSQDEYSGNNFSLIETVQGEMIRLPHSKEMAAARHHGNLQPGAYIRVRRTGQEQWNIVEHGNADLLLSDSQFLRENAGRLAELVPTGYEGWLGRLRRAVDQARDRDNYRSR